MNQETTGEYEVSQRQSRTEKIEAGGAQETAA
jgi:hypothetical protein